MNWRDIPVPPRMGALARDRRGFPVPFIVARDNAGEPLFTVNDDRLTSRCVAELRCGICGGELEIGDLWWVGGPLSSFHPNGAFVDGPMHRECSTYALQVCPHLAAPRYTKRLDGAPGQKNGTSFASFMDPTVMPDRPVVFVQGRSHSYSVSWPRSPNRHLYPCSGIDQEGRSRRWLDYEVWRHGVMLDEEEGLALIRKAIEDAQSQRTQAPRLIVPDNSLVVP